MSKGIIVSLAAIVIIAGAAYYFGFDHGWEGAFRQTPTPTATLAATVSPSQSPTATPVPRNVVTYGDSGYSPATLKVKKGSVVTWQNNSSSGMWTASALHPTHKVYPGTDTTACGTQTLVAMFDACANTPSGKSWSFTFNNTGTWKYHNHSRSAHTGTIIVE
jgi:plastocyanin